MTRSTIYIDRILDDLPHAPPGTPLARDVAVIRESLLRAKARLATLDRRTEFARSPETGRIIV